VNDPFATLGLPRAYALDLKAAEKTHRELSRALHPDRYVASGATERRLALSRAVEVNEAWRVVKDPIRRAEALFELAGVAVGDTHEPKPAPSLLMDMMDRREALAEARARRDIPAVRALAKEITAREEQTVAHLGAAFERAAGDRAELLPLVGALGELRYYRRFLEEAAQVSDDLAAAS
jgi:molecular chaperone HscB